MLVAGDVREALLEPRQQLLLLVVVEHEVLAGQRQRALDDHVVGDYEVDLGLHVTGVCDQPPAGLDEVIVEELDEGVGHVLAREGQAVADERVVEPHDLAEVAVEELHVPRLVDLLGGEKRLLLLVLVGHDEPGELRGHPLLSHEERREAPEMLLPLLLRQRRPLLLVSLQVDRLRLPLLALPELVELLRGHELEGAVEIRVVADGCDVALRREIQKRGHGATLTRTQQSER